ncbi:hypothetical protein ABH935_006744 [Catenulispora sp. GAS73]|uniref:hypothetical protein n=1 Tax=Catenulispora sp. GAS73 TaxID=3156269 RepID=UPI003511F6BF
MVAVVSLQDPVRQSRRSGELVGEHPGVGWSDSHRPSAGTGAVELVGGSVVAP